MIVCTWGPGGEALAANAALPPISVTAALRPSATTSPLLAATVSGITPEPPSSDPSDNVSHVDITPIAATADLVVTHTLESDALVAGAAARYRVQIANNGPSDARAVWTTSALSSGLAFVGIAESSSGSAWDCAPSLSGVTCDHTSDNGTLAAGETAWFVYEVTLDSALTGLVFAAVSVASMTTDSNSTNNSSVLTTPVVTETDLAVTLSHDDVWILEPGEETTFAITVTNDGPSDAVGVRVVKTLPPGISVVGFHADDDGTPDGPAVATQTLATTASAGTIVGQVLWPGAAVDENGVGIAWPGWRRASFGETPMRENYVLDPTLRDELPAALRVLEVEVADQADPTQPTWDCRVTDQDDDGYGGVLECVLVGWIGYDQAAPQISLTAELRPGTSLGPLTNTAVAQWSDPDDGYAEVLEAADAATFVVVLSAAELLALTGADASTMSWTAVLLVVLGLAVAVVARRRRARPLPARSARPADARRRSAAALGG